MPETFTKFDSKKESAGKILGGKSSAGAESSSRFCSGGVDIF
jgi:hypothetical protein